MDVKTPTKPAKTPLRRDDESCGLSLGELLETLPTTEPSPPKDWIIEVGGGDTVAYIIIPYYDENGLFQFMSPDKSKAVRNAEKNAKAIARELANHFKANRPQNAGLVFTAIEDKK